MQLVNFQRKFKAKDPGIVAVGVQSREETVLEATVMQNTSAQEMQNTHEAVAEKTSETATVEKVSELQEKNTRLGNLIQRLRDINSKLRKDNHRLTKENKVLQGELNSEDRLTVDDIVHSKNTTSTKA